MVLFSLKYTGPPASQGHDPALMLVLANPYGQRVSPGKTVKSRAPARDSVKRQFLHGYFLRPWLEAPARTADKQAAPIIPTTNT